MEHSTVKNGDGAAANNFPLIVALPKLKSNEDFQKLTAVLQFWQKEKKKNSYKEAALQDLIRELPLIRHTHKASLPL